MKQPRLFEQEQSVFARIRLGDLPSDAELLGPGPSPALVRQIEANGMDTAINVIRKDDGELLVLGGARRIKALRLADYDEDYMVPCLVRPWRGAEDLIEAIALNTTAQRNRPAEVRNIIELCGMMTAAAVAHEVGASLRDVEIAIAISRLPENIYIAFLNGEVAYGTAKLAASCSPIEQDELAVTLELDGRLRRADVLALRRVTAKAVDIEQLELFEDDDEVRWSVTQQGGVLRLRSSDGRVGVIDLDGVSWRGEEGEMDEDS